MYKIEFAKRVVKFYERVDDPTARRLNRIFERFSEYPYNIPNVKHLKG
jgi:hypothetical protein